MKLEIVLLLQQGKSVKEIAKAAGCTLGNVRHYKKQLELAQKRLAVGR
jgi:DNA-binding NarL/FixJ family response regulator